MRKNIKKVFLIMALYVLSIIQHMFACDQYLSERMKMFSDFEKKQEDIHEEKLFKLSRAEDFFSETDLKDFENFLNNWHKKVETIKFLYNINEPWDKKNIVKLFNDGYPFVEDFAVSTRFLSASEYLKKFIKTQNLNILKFLEIWSKVFFISKYNEYISDCAIYSYCIPILIEKIKKKQTAQEISIFYEHLLRLAFANLSEKQQMPANEGKRLWLKHILYNFSNRQDCALNWALKLDHYYVRNTEEVAEVLPKNIIYEQNFILNNVFPILESIN